MKNVFILHSNEGVHLIASNVLVVYSCLKDHEDQILISHMRSYSWYCNQLMFCNDVAIPLKNDRQLVISKRPVMSKWIAEIQGKCAIDHVK
jgi:hypothetical protein